MRQKSEIMERLSNYTKNLNSVSDKEGHKNVKYMMAELDWVLGGDGK